jgi:apolipoprotein N-acyltransferase
VDVEGNAVMENQAVRKSSANACGWLMGLGFVLCILCWIGGGSLLGAAMGGGMMIAGVIAAAIGDH